MSKSSQRRRVRRQLERQEAAKLATARRALGEPEAGSELHGTQALQLMYAQRSEVHVGPLPHPESLAAYANISPTLVDRIVTMAEKQASHRQSLERTLVEGEIAGRRHSVNAAMVVALGAFVTAGVLGWKGHEWAAGIIGGLDIVGVVGIFIYGRKKQPKRKPPEDAVSKKE